MEETVVQPRYKMPCKCDTGSYCGKHERYYSGTAAREKVYRSVRDRTLKTETQKCGGGIRLFRNTVGD